MISHLSPILIKMTITNKKNKAMNHNQLKKVMIMTKKYY